MAVLHITYYDIWPSPMTMTTNVAKEYKNEKHKIIWRKVVNEQKTRYKGSQIYTRGTAPLRRPLAEKIIIPERCTWPYLNAYKISTF